MWWRLLVAAGALLVLLGLGSLEIVVDHIARAPRATTAPETTAEEPERAWERSNDPSAHRP